MYMKEPEKCYRYNDAEDADFTKIVDPKHTALLMIDMQNDFCSPKGKFAQAGRAADSIIEIVPACRKLLEAADRPMYSSLPSAKYAARGSRVITEAG